MSQTPFRLKITGTKIDLACPPPDQSTCMFPPDILAADLAATLLVVIAPGPDNVLAISRGLSQGRAAAVLSSFVSAGHFDPGAGQPALSR